MKEQRSARFPGVKEIAVLRGGGIGDLVMAMPAMNALADAYPSAKITLLGMPSHAAILQDRHTCISHVAMLPVAEGIRVEQNGDGSERLPDAKVIDGFMGAMQATRFDLAVQLHGGGRFSNPFVHRLKAAHTIGSRAADAGPLERTTPHQYFQHEVLRGLEVSALAGATSTNYVATWHATAGERERASSLLRRFRPGWVLVLLHPGAKDVRRRWPAARFAAVGASLVDDGCQVLVLGDGGDAGLAAEIVDRGRRLLAPGSPAAALASVAGEVDLGTMCGLLSKAALLIANDSGPRHVAQALGVPTASIFWAPNVVNAAPLMRARHRVQIAWNTACPVCGSAAAGTVVPDCGHDCSFVADVPVGAVLKDALALL